MTNRKKITKRTKVALLLILGPTLIIFTSLLVLAVSNVASGSVPETLPASCNAGASEQQGGLAPSQECQNDLFGEQSPAQTTINSLLFVTAGLGILTWLPALIIGIILFVKRPKEPSGPDYIQQ